MQGKKFLFSYFILLGLGKQCLAQEEYFPEVDGWLRLHIVPRTWSDARLRCEQEGGELASPTSNALTTALMKMMNASIMKDRSVFIGLRNSVFKRDVTSINGVPLSAVSLKWAEGLPNSADNAEDCLVMTDAGELADVSCDDSVHPYFCYKINSLTRIATRRGYVLEPRTGSWYKFFPGPRSWYPAQSDCVLWGGHLAVINSDLESQVLKELFAKHPANTIQGNVVSHNRALIGFIYTTGGWRVASGSNTLTEAGFAAWAAGHEPNVVVPFHEGCGTMTRNGLLDNTGCSFDFKLPFICEIENVQCSTTHY